MGAPLGPHRSTLMPPLGSIRTAGAGDTVHFFKNDCPAVVGRQTAQRTLSCVPREIRAYDLNHVRLCLHSDRTVCLTCWPVDELLRAPWCWQRMRKGDIIFWRSHWVLLCFHQGSFTSVLCLDLWRIAFAMSQSGGNLCSITFQEMGKQTRVPMDPM